MGDPVVEPQPLDVRLVPAVVMCWGATIVAVTCGWRAGLTLAAALVVAGVALAVGVRRSRRAGNRGASGRSVARRHRRGVVVVSALAAVLAGGGFAVAAAWQEYRVATHPLRAAAAGTYVTIVATPVDDPKPLTRKAFGGRQWLVRANLREYRHGEVPVRAGGAVVIIAPDNGWPRVLPGETVEFRARTDRPWRRDLTVTVLRAQGPPRTVSGARWYQDIAGAVRARFVAACDRALPDDAAGLLPGLVAGDVSHLPEHVRENFEKTDLAHLTAASGMNVSILFAAVLLTVRLLTLDARLGIALAAAALMMFVILARPSPSVLRAAAMGAIALLAATTGRRKQALPALCAAVLGLLAYSPALAVNAGFALSVFATAGLILLAPNWALWLQRHGWPRPVAEAFAVATAAFLVTTPIIAALTGHVGLLAILANVLVEPVVAPITILGTVAAALSCLYQPAAVLLLHLTGPPLWWLLAVAEHGAALDISLIVPSGLRTGLTATTITGLLILVLYRLALPSTRHRTTAPLRPDPASTEGSPPNQRAPTGELPLDQRAPSGGSLPDRPVPADGLLPDRSVPVERSLPDRPAPTDGSLPDRPAPAGSSLPGRPVPAEGSPPNQRAPTGGSLLDQPVPADGLLPDRSVPVERSLPNHQRRKPHPSTSHESGRQHGRRSSGVGRDVGPHP
ncbi:ComEC/Rec2 family competence protein [Nocardia wallacei]|uniref:ComEC/Rec2 family competence protein n=1 Tax=Nocardia wallacei TaxID=480035 RepID=UPI002454A219|nr:ComEC/Rec2 family competence protein [Nocardia wallacei]